MLVSEKKGFLFVHVPKTGGTSLVSALKHDSDRAFLPLRLVGYFFDDRGVKLPTWTYNYLGYPYHVTASTLISLWGMERFSRYYSFAFVRNPFDLVVSEYEYIRNKRVHPHHKKVRCMSGFSEYLLWKSDNYARPQLMWIADDDDNILVDFVGRFESYSEDANSILKRFGYDCMVPHKNATKRKDYRVYYNDNDVDLVCSMYRRDIEAFGYSF